MSKRERLRSLIHDRGLLSSALSRGERSDGVKAIAHATGVSVGTVYRHINLIKQGKAERKGRSDKGKSRALPEDVQSAARALLGSRRWKDMPTTALQRELQRLFPEAQISYASLQRLRKALAADPRRPSHTSDAGVATAEASPSVDSVAQPRTPKPRTPRQMPAGLRYRILKRDGFRCVICGRSPANNLGVELEVDHIIPVSKGGDNSPSNLRTTCSECNLGKSGDTK